MNGERPSRLPPRRPERPGDALREQKKFQVSPEMQAFSTEHAHEIALELEALRAFLAERLRAAKTLGKDGSATVLVQTQALLILAFRSLQKTRPETAESMLAIGMDAGSQKTQDYALKLFKKLEKLRQKGHNVDHLLPPGYAFNAQGRVVIKGTDQPA